MNKKTLFVLLGSLILVFGTFLGVKAINASTEKKAAEAAEQNTVLYDVDSLKSFSLTYDGKTIALTKESDGWTLEDDASFPMDEEKAETLEDSLLHMEAAKILEETLSNTDAYGLTSPQLTLHCVSEDGQTITLFLGDYSDFAGQYYASVDGQDRVYLLDTDLPESLFLHQSDFLLMDSVPSIAISDIQELRVSSGVETKTGYTLRYEENGLSSCYTDSYKWFFDAGTPLPCDETKAKTLAQQATGLTPSGCAAWGVTDFAPYGLDASASSAVLQYLESYTEYDTDGNASTQTLQTEFTIWIGTQAEDGTYYVRLGDSDQVLYVSADAAEALLQAEYEDVRPDDVFLLPLDTVEGMAVTTADEETDITLVRTENTDEDGVVTTDTAYQVSGITIDADAFETFYSSLEALSAESQAEESAANEELLLEIDFTRNTSSFRNMTLRITRYDTDFCRVSFAGRDDQLVNRRDVEALLTAWNAL